MWYSMMDGGGLSLLWHGESMHLYLPYQRCFQLTSIKGKAILKENLLTGDFILLRCTLGKSVSGKHSHGKNLMPFIWLMDSSCRHVHEKKRGVLEHARKREYIFCSLNAHASSAFLQKDELLSSGFSGNGEDDEKVYLHWMQKLAFLVKECIIMTPCSKRFSSSHAQIVEQMWNLSCEIVKRTTIVRFVSSAEN